LFIEHNQEILVKLFLEHNQEILVKLFIEHNKEVISKLLEAILIRKVREDHKFIDKELLQESCPKQGELYRIVISNAKNNPE